MEVQHKKSNKNGKSFWNILCWEKNYFVYNFPYYNTYTNIPLIIISFYVPFCPGSLFLNCVLNINCEVDFYIHTEINFVVLFCFVSFVVWIICYSNLSFPRESSLKNVILGRAYINRPTQFSAPCDIRKAKRTGLKFCWN